MSAEAQVLKGHLDVLLLAALEDGAQHGYAIKEALRTGSGGRFDLPTGTIYPALHRLERAGLITGSWSVVDGRRRRSYRLTDTGRRRLARERGNWRAFAAAITALLEHTPLTHPPLEHTSPEHTSREQMPLENGPWPATT
jgi:PadR family transcriptional regulator, regulatory protein PadR